MLNGTEIGGGSIRIHQRQMQAKVLQVLGIGEEEAQDKFGFLLRALELGRRRTAVWPLALTG